MLVDRIDVVVQPDRMCYSQICSPRCLRTSLQVLPVGQAFINPLHRSRLPVLVFLPTIVGDWTRDVEVQHSPQKGILTK